MPSPTQLFNKITGLELSEGSEQELLSQINNYQKNDQLRSGLKDAWSDSQSFEYCWDQSKNGPSSQATPIPGHHRAKSDKSAAKSPKSPTFLGKSPTTSGKSPSSELVSMSDQSLHQLKMALLDGENRLVKKFFHMY